MIHVAIPGICGEGLSFSYHRWEIILTVVVLLIGSIIAVKNVKKPYGKAAAAGVLLASACIFGADDLFTNYICFELVGFLSVFWLADEPDSHTSDAIKKYVGWLVITGMIMTMGMFLISHYAGTLVYSQILSGEALSGIPYYAVLACYLVGYGSRCAVVMLHSWIDSTYREESMKKGILYSVLLIPTGTWSLLRLFSSLTVDFSQWKSIAEMMGVIGGLTIVLGIYRIWTCREKGVLLGDISMLLSGGLLISVFWKASSGQSAVFCLIGYIVVIMIVYGILLKIDWKPKHSLDLEWFSAEHMLYEPLFVHALPFLFGTVFRLIDYLPDAFVALLRGTIYQDSKQKVWDKVGTPATYIVGSILDEIANLLNKTILRKRPIRKSFVNAAAVARRESRETLEIVTRSVSFGLMMFSVGMMIVLIYIMF